VKPMRRVWRVERSYDGLGPFTAGLWNTDWNRYCVGNHNPRHMPSPYTANHLRGPNKVGSYDEYYYGFDRLETLARWVCEHRREEAHARDFVIRVLGVPWDSHALKTDQIVYRRRDAVVIRELSLLEVPTELEVCQLRQMAA